MAAAGTRAEAAAARAARVLSFLAAAALSALLFVYPRVLGAEPDGATYGALVMTMAGVCAAFAHGVGFSWESRVLRWCLGPVCAWPLMAVGGFLLFAQ